MLLQYFNCNERLEIFLTCFCNILFYVGNLPRNRCRLSQVTSPYKLFINNHSIKFEQNSLLFNSSQEFTRNVGISQPS